MVCFRLQETHIDDIILPLCCWEKACSPGLSTHSKCMSYFGSTGDIHHSWRGSSTEQLWDHPTGETWWKASLWTVSHMQCWEMQSCLFDALAQECSSVCLQHGSERCNILMAQQLQLQSSVFILATVNHKRKILTTYLSMTRLGLCWWMCGLVPSRNDTIKKDLNGTPAVAILNKEKACVSSV